MKKTSSKFIEPSQKHSPASFWGVLYPLAMDNAPVREFIVLFKCWFVEDFRTKPCLITSFFSGLPTRALGLPKVWIDWEDPPSPLDGCRCGFFFKKKQVHRVSSGLIYPTFLWNSCLWFLWRSCRPNKPYVFYPSSGPIRFFFSSLRRTRCLARWKQNHGKTTDFTQNEYIDIYI